MKSTTLSQTDPNQEPEPNSSRRPDTSPLPLPGSGTARRVLFLDDDPFRAEAFLAENPQAVWVKTVTECLSELIEPWDEVHLDHDLGGKQFVDTNENDCGMEVIRWLCQEPRPHLHQTFFLVHTHNTVAGLLMVLQMRERGYLAEFRPFGLDLTQLLSLDDPNFRECFDRAQTPLPTVGKWLTWLRSWWSSMRGRAS